MPDKSLAQKLLFKDNYVVVLLNEPENYSETLGEIPAGVKITSNTEKPVDLVQVFIKTKAEMEQILPGLKTRLKSSSLLWLTYPKGKSKEKTDINRDVIREYVEKHGFKTVSLVSVDETWSAMRLKPV